MKVLKDEFNLAVLLLATLILFQSCRVYHRKIVTLDQAVKEDKRVKIRTNNNETLKFRRVMFEDGEFYGVNRIRGKIVRIPISQQGIKYVRVHNKTWSIIYGIVTGVVVTYGVAIILFLLTWNGLGIGTGLQFPN